MGDRTRVALSLALSVVVPRQSVRVEEGLRTRFGMASWRSGCGDYVMGIVEVIDRIM